MKDLHSKWLDGTEYRKDRQALTQEFERARAEVLIAVAAAEGSLARGEGRTISELSMRELAIDVKRRGRVRLSSEQHRR